MFWRGVLLGMAVMALLVLALAIYEIGNYEAMYREMGSSARLPQLTRWMLGGAWRAGAPLVCGALIGVVAYRRPASLAPYIVAVVLTVAAVVATWYGIAMPLWQLAGSIE